MKLRLSRRNFLITGIATSLLVTAAWAQDQHVVGFATPTAVEAGSGLQATISVNQGAVNVNVTSNPPGLVNQTVSTSSGSTTTVLSTNPNAAAGTYQLIATPVGGGGSYSQQIQATINSDL